MSSGNAVTGDPKKDFELFKNMFAEDAAFVGRELFDGSGGLVCAVFFFNGMANGLLASESIVEPIARRVEKGGEVTADSIFRIVTNIELKKETDPEKLAAAAMYGDAVVLVRGGALVAGTKDWEKRGITEPQGETVIRGPREGFIESALDNVSMIRRRLKTKDLRVEKLEFGEYTKTSAYMCSIRGIADEKVRSELKRRIAEIPVRDILDSNYLAEQIRDNKHSPFKTVGVTERPDTVASRLLEGRTALVVDGTPCVVTMPYLFIENFQSGEDYYTGFIFASINRLIRFAGFLISALTPAFYISVVNYHQEMLPTVMLLSISKSRQGVPFPTIVELLLLLAAFDILREASLRMSNNIGQALSIVGALIIGQAAVEAKFVSAPVVIIVALAGTTSMLAAPLTGGLICVRIFMVVLTSVFGMTGFAVGTVAVTAHLCAMDSFGVPYLSLEKTRRGKAPDAFVRKRWGTLRYRKLFRGGGDIDAGTR